MQLTPEERLRLEQKFPADFQIPPPCSGEFLEDLANNLQYYAKIGIAAATAKSDDDSKFYEQVLANIKRKLDAEIGAVGTCEFARETPPSELPKPE